MIAKAWRRCGSDLLASEVGLAVAASDLSAREMYHRVAAQSVGLTLLVGAAILAAVGTWTAYRFLRRHRVCVAQRLIVVTSLAVAWYWLVGAAIATSWEMGALARLAIVATTTSVLFVIFLLLQASVAVWSRVRSAMVLALFLFVASQPVLANLWAKDVPWPAGQDSHSADQDANRRVTIVLLLDELNASSSANIVQVLAQHGLRPNVRAVVSVGTNTANVLPELFLGRPFPAARPCGLSMICSGSTVLDFSRVHATRPDIDVVGFFHPYCAISGLRSCHREGLNLAWFDSGRWECGMRRRTGWITQADKRRCRKIYIDAWSSMTERVLSDVRQAPALTQGGLLFAHLPLPHPPGLAAEGTLAEHYANNVLRAADVLEGMLESTERSGLQVRVVITSDHPLRQAMWCKDFVPYAWDGCRPIKALQDKKVPLIVAGAGAPDLSEFETNLAFFSIPAAWPKEAARPTGSR